MNQSLRVLLLVVLLHPLGHVCAQQDDLEPLSIDDPYRALFWDDHRRGWHFYEDPVRDAPVAAPKPTPQAKPKPEHPRTERPIADTSMAPRRAPELVEFEKLQKRLEDFRNIAIMSPTESNVRRYMELEASVVRQASYFADVAQRVAWATPSLDMTQQGRPVNARAIEVFDRAQTQERNQSLAHLAHTHVLFFFFRSDCPYCHAFAPTLEAFQARHGIQIVPISVDGGGLPNFPQFRRDNGISRTLQVTQVPAVFLAEPFSGKITPIGSGVLSESQLVERITTVAAPGAEALVPSATRQINFK